MLSVATIRAQSRILLNEPTAAFWSDTDFTSWCQLIAGDISSKTLCYEQSKSVTLVNATPEYPYSGWSLNCIKILGVIINGVGIKKFEPWMQGVQTVKATGMPEYFYDFAMYLGLYPVPTTIEAAYPCKIFYADWTNDISLIPDKYLFAAVLATTSLGLLKERQYQKAMVMQQQYMALLGFDRQEQKAPIPPQSAYIVPATGGANG